ncbi:hypothetical protein BE221DRAFT_76626 [Ostreococcus tauri]|uniref:Uncharacterized protein n=1 Tax=Ostreococcus tauri TaxID=70448 RepID=A0A1Y5I766_OSTTA|nr:hypothetical protein BE221DRAFT_76626 [Ostreococcus tauri]
MGVWKKRHQTTLRGVVMAHAGAPTRSRTRVVIAAIAGAVCGVAACYAYAYGSEIFSVSGGRRAKRVKENVSDEEATEEEEIEEAVVTAETAVISRADAAATRRMREKTEETSGTARSEETRATRESTSSIDVKHTANATAVYESLEIAFAMGGLDASALTPRRFFSFGRWPEAGVWPRKYAELSMPLDCARLVIISLEDAPAIVAAVQGATRELIRLVGGKMDAFAPGRQELHVTLFHVSRTFEYVQAPATFAVENASGTTRTLPRTLPIENAIAFEESAIADAVKGCGTCELEVDRVCLAPSGCLLLCFKDVNGGSQVVRERLRDKVVGAATKQNDTLHCTLARLFPKTEDSQLDDTTVAAINVMCQKVTSSLRHARFTARNLTYVVEEHYGRTDGRRSRIML